MLEIFIVTILVLLVIYKTFLQSSSDAKYIINRIPGPATVPFFGNSFILIALDFKDFLNWVKQCYDAYGPIYRFWNLGVPYVIIQEAEDIEILLNNSHNIAKGAQYKVFSKWLNEGLLVSKDEKWRHRRKTLTPTFHFKILDDCISIFNRCAMNLTNELLKTDGKPIPVEHCISKSSLDIICDASMGYPLTRLPGKSAHNYIHSIRKINKLMMLRMLTPWLDMDWIFKLTPTSRDTNKELKEIHSFTAKIVRERKEEYKINQNENSETKKENKRLRSFLDCLLELHFSDPPAITEDGIREEVDTFMFEGHDTVSAAISAALYLIGKHHDIQERIYNELLDVYGYSDEDCKNDDIKKLIYLERVIKETLRLFPSVPIISREITKQITFSKGKYNVPVGSTAVVSIYHAHRNENYYSDPENFNPDRFLPEEVIKRHPFAYIPFSGGPRNCIGQKFAMLEIKVVLSAILRKFKIDTIVEEREVKLIPAVILRPDIPFQIKFIPRLQ